MNELNFGAFNSLYDLFEAFPTEASCIAFLENKRWENGVVSPYDPTSKVYHRGDGNYRCKNTGKNFNVRVGTIFEGTKLPLRKWFMAIYLICNHKKAISDTVCKAEQVKRCDYQIVARSFCSLRATDMQHGWDK